MMNFPIQLLLAMGGIALLWKFAVAILNWKKKDVCVAFWREKSSPVADDIRKAFEQINQFGPAWARTTRERGLDYRVLYGNRQIGDEERTVDCVLLIFRLPRFGGWWRFLPPFFESYDHKFQGVIGQFKKGLVTGGVISQDDLRKAGITSARFEHYLVPTSKKAKVELGPITGSLREAVLSGGTLSLTVVGGVGYVCVATDSMFFNDVNGKILQSMCDVDNKGWDDIRRLWFAPQFLTEFPPSIPIPQASLPVMLSELLVLDTPVSDHSIELGALKGAKGQRAWLDLDENILIVRAPAVGEVEFATHVQTVLAQRCADQGEVVVYLWFEGSPLIPGATLNVIDNSWPPNAQAFQLAEMIATEEPGAIHVIQSVRQGEMAQNSFEMLLRELHACQLPTRVRIAFPRVVPEMTCVAPWNATTDNQPGQVMAQVRQTARESALMTELQTQMNNPNPNLRFLLVLEETDFSSRNPLDRIYANVAKGCSQYLWLRWSMQQEATGQWGFISSSSSSREVAVAVRGKEVFRVILDPELVNINHAAIQPRVAQPSELGVLVGLEMSDVQALRDRGVVTFGQLAEMTEDSLRSLIGDKDVYGILQQAAFGAAHGTQALLAEIRRMMTPAPQVTVPTVPSASTVPVDVAMQVAQQLLNPNPPQPTTTPVAQGQSQADLLKAQADAMAAAQQAFAATAGSLDADALAAAMANQA